MDVTWNLAFSFSELLFITKVFVKTEVVVLAALLILPMAEVPPEHFQRIEPSYIGESPAVSSSC